MSKKMPKPSKGKEEQTFTFEEYLKKYAPKPDKPDEASDDVELVATAMAEETLAILKSGLEDS